MIAHARRSFALALALLLATTLGAACGDDETGGSGGNTTTGTGGSGTGSGGGATTGSGGSGGGAACADTQSDPANCGACGHPCAPGQTCQAGVCSCGTDTVSFANDVQPILTASCAGSMCHDADMPKEGLDLSAGSAHAALTGGMSEDCTPGRALVVPGQPSESYLMSKLLGTELCGGNRMPPNPTGLAEDKIKTIADWICGGALND